MSNSEPQDILDSSDDLSKDQNSRAEIDLEILAFSRNIPISYQVDLSPHTKAVTAISVDPAGNRVVTGSLDYNVKIYDFGGMDNRFRGFNSFEADEGHPVTSISHSPNGDRFVVGTGSCQPRVFDRDGKEIIKFVRGDMYIRDATNTKGHTMEITGVIWHPIHKDCIVTSSLDGTLRIWDLLGESVFGNLVNKHVLKVRSLVAAAGQQRIGASCCTISSNGKFIGGGATDGTIHIWNEKKVYSRPDIIIKNAHGVSGTSMSTVSCITFSPDNQTLVSRGLDGNIKVWNIKKSQQAVRVYANYPNLYSNANIAFSPDGDVFICGTSSVSELNNTNKSMKSSIPITEDSKAPLLCFFDLTSKDSKCLMQLGLSGAGSIISISWPKLTNQIVCSTSRGFTRVFYDPKLSKKGVIFAAGRTPKREKDPADLVTSVGAIYNPLALPMYRNDIHTERKRAKEMTQLTVPHKPVESGPGSRMNTSFFFTNYVTSGGTLKSSREEDPREALLKMDALAKQDPLFTGKAYKETQPQTILSTMTFEQEQEEFTKKQKTF